MFLHEFSPIGTNYSFVNLISRILIFNAISFVIIRAIRVFFCVTLFSPDRSGKLCWQCDYFFLTVHRDQRKRVEWHRKKGEMPANPAYRQAGCNVELDWLQNNCPPQIHRLLVCFMNNLF